MPRFAKDDVKLSPCKPFHVKLYLRTRNSRETDVMEKKSVLSAAATWAKPFSAV
jgi:hypothetical protein